MKKILCFILILAASLSAGAQAWYWGRYPVNKAGASASGNATATDRSGNVYNAGSFTCDTLFFGLYALHGASFGSSNMFVTKYDTYGNIQWAAGAGGTAPGNDVAYAVCTDSIGSVYVAGAFHSPTIKFGTTTLTRVANDDIFLVKYDSNGVVKWAKSVGGTGADDALALCSDRRHHIYMTGYFSSTNITLGSTTLTNTNSGTNDIFLAQYDTSGTLNWAKSAGGTGDDRGKAVTTDRLGNAFITGSFASATMTVGTSVLTNSASTNLFVAKYDANGNVLWANAAGGPGFASGSGISADSAGNSYFTGTYGPPSVSFGTNTLLDTGASDVLVVKYDPSGNTRWAKRIGGRLAETAGGIHFDGALNSFVCGSYTSDTLGFGTIFLPNDSIATSDIFVAKYDTLGNIEWANKAGGPKADFGNAVTSDPRGDAFVAGSFQSPIVPSIGTSELDNLGIQNAFLAKIQGPPLGIKNYTLGMEAISVYPNPARDAVTLQLSKSLNHPFTVSIYDQTGQEVRRLSHLSSSQIIIPKENLQSGIYYFILRDEVTDSTGRGKLMFME
jgi:hypothetical protein